MRRSNSARVARSSAARRSFQARRAPAASGVPAWRQQSRTSAGISKAGSLQPSFSRAPLISSAPSGEPCAVVCAGLGRRAVADGGAAGDQRRPVGVLAPASMAAAMASGSWPSTRVAAQPAASKRFTWSTESASDSGPSIEMPLSSNSTISLVELEVPGERDRLLADALHQVAVGGEHVGVVIDDLSPNTAARWRSAIAMPTALARPWPSGPVVVSTPGRDEVLRMAGRDRAQLAEALDLLDGHPLVAEQMQQRSRSASSRGRPTARSGRGRARPDRRGRTSGSG